jgi:hypothetical protein
MKRTRETEFRAYRGYDLDLGGWEQEYEKST